MNIQSYHEQHLNDAPNADVIARWQARVVAQGLNQRGRAGAENYLARYGKGLGESKALGLAAIARVKGCHEMYARFLEQAFFLATGKSERLGVEACSASIEENGSATPVREAFCILPQLLTAITHDEAFRLLEDPQWGVQEKIDGERSLSCCRNGHIAAGNRSGLARVLPLNLAEALQTFGDAETDGEHVAETNRLHLFDFLSVDGRDLRNCGFGHRYDELERWLSERSKNDSVPIVPLVRGSTAAKLAFVRGLKERGAEGFVLKRLDAPYVSGKQHQIAWKFQFRKRIAVVVGAKNPGKDSVQIHVFNDDGSPRGLGSVRFTPSRGAPNEGSVIEVQYLYCHRGADGCLAQADLIGVRTDVLPAECTADKLQYKPAA